MQKKGIIIIVGVILLSAFLYTQFSSNAPSYVEPDKVRAVLGNQTATVKVVEFGDLQCPACRSAHGTVDIIVAEYGDRISYEFKHFPLESIHPLAFLSAQAAECAHDQDKYYEFIEQTFVYQHELSKARLKTTAVALGLDSALFDACLDSGVKRSFVRQHQQEARSLRVSSTPSFFVNGQLLQSWQLSAFRTTLDTALAQ